VPLEQAVERAEAQLADLRTRLLRFEKTWESYPGSVSQDAIDQTRQQVKASEASLGEAKANLAAVKAGAWEYEVREQEAALSAKRASLKEASQVLSWHTVRAPKDGAILQINVRPGEWIAPGQAESPVLMGRTDRLQIRADIDEVNAVDVQKGARAIAYLRGYTDRQIPLEFERVDPYIIPKRQLTGSTTERVDVRVLQVIYRFTPPDFPVYAGQQVDIFIESKERPKN
jgi:multidrug resistance efflux pump